MLRLFLSYAHEDATPARRLSADLSRPGIEPWMDDELKLAGVWNEEINDRIAACDFFMPLLSVATQNGEATRFFRREWELARDSQRVFLPVRLEPSELPVSLSADLVDVINRRQREDLFPSYDDSLRRILRFLHEEKRTGVFEETFSCLGPDNLDWRLGGWQLDDADTTGGRSGSIHGAARTNHWRLLPQDVKHTASIDIDVPSRPLTIRYRRRLHLAAPWSTARFRAAFDGEIIEEVSDKDPGGDDWVTRSAQIPDHGERRGRLEFTVSVASRMNYLPVAEAWIDDLRIA